MVLENRTATDLAKLKDAGEAGSAEWNAVFQRANFKQYNMRLKAKVRTGCVCACVIFPSFTSFFFAVVDAEGGSE